MKTESIAHDFACNGTECGQLFQVLTQSILEKEERQSPVSCPTCGRDQKKMVPGKIITVAKFNAHGVTGGNGKRYSIRVYERKGTVLAYEVFEDENVIAEQRNAEDGEDEATLVNRIKATIVRQA
jgi:hypothetical protein